MSAEKLINAEIKGCFDFFWKESNGFKDGPGYGLTLDITGRATASLASVGFALPAYVIGVERGFISFDEGYERCLKTLKTVKNVEHKNGYLVHFVDQETGVNHRSEYSTIDTSILLMGAITAGEFFEGEVKTLAKELLDRVDFNWIVCDQGKKKIFRMAYSEEVYKKQGGWNAYWDHYAEQLMMYFLCAGSGNVEDELAVKLYYDFDRNIGSYKGHNMVHCFGNALFIHQFTHCFIDFRKYHDAQGMDWHQNSVAATLANRQYCIDQKWSKTYNENSWGLTACQTEKGYRVFGAPPYGFGLHRDKPKEDGSVAPYAALSSINFTPKETIAMLEEMSKNKNLFGEYGIYDSYNYEDGESICKRYLGIDKGPTILMLDNYLHQTTWKYFMKSDVFKKAVKVLGFQKM